MMLRTHETGFLFLAALLPEILDGLLTAANWIGIGVTVADVVDDTSTDEQRQIVDGSSDLVQLGSLYTRVINASARALASLAPNDDARRGELLAAHQRTNAYIASAVSSLQAYSAVVVFEAFCLNLIARGTGAATVAHLKAPPELAAPSASGTRTALLALGALVLAALVASMRGAR